MALTANQDWLYKQMSGRNVDLGSEEQFAQAMQDESNRQWVYEQAGKMGIDLGTPEQFASAMQMPDVAEVRQATGGVSGGSLLSEQEELARQNAYQGATNDPNHPFVEKRPSFWQSIGGHNPYPISATTDIQGRSRQQQQEAAAQDAARAQAEWESMLAPYKEQFEAQWKQDAPVLDEVWNKANERAKAAAESVQRNKPQQVNLPSVMGGGFGNIGYSLIASREANKQNSPEAIIEAFERELDNKYQSKDVKGDIQLAQEMGATIDEYQLYKRFVEDKIAERFVGQNIPQDKLDYFARKFIQGNLIAQLASFYTQSPQSRQYAMQGTQQYEQANPGWATKGVAIGAEVANVVADPLMWIMPGVGEAAGRGIVNAAGRRLASVGLSDAAGAAERAAMQRGLLRTAQRLTSGGVMMAGIDTGHTLVGDLYQTGEVNWSNLATAPIRGALTGMAFAGGGALGERVQKAVGDVFGRDLGLVAGRATHFAAGTNIMVGSSVASHILQGGSPDDIDWGIEYANAAAMQLFFDIQGGLKTASKAKGFGNAWKAMRQDPMAHTLTREEIEQFNAVGIEGNDAYTILKNLNGGKEFTSLEEYYKVLNDISADERIDTQAKYKLASLLYGKVDAHVSPIYVGDVEAVADGYVVKTYDNGGMTYETRKFDTQRAADVYRARQHDATRNNMLEWVEGIIRTRGFAEKMQEVTDGAIDKTIENYPQLSREDAYRVLSADEGSLTPIERAIRGQMEKYLAEDIKGSDILKDVREQVAREQGVSIDDLSNLLSREYSRLSAKDKTVFENYLDRLNEYMPRNNDRTERRAIGEGGGLGPNPPEETTPLSPAAAEHQRAVDEVTQAVQERTHGNGYIYPIAMPGNAEKTGFIVGEVVPVIDESDPEQLRIENDDIVTVKWSDGTVTQERARDLDLTGAPMMAQQAVDIEVENRMYGYTQQRIQNGEQPVLMRNSEGILEGFFPTEGGLLEDQNGVQYTPEQLVEQEWQETKPVLFVNDTQQIATLDNGDGTYTQVDALGNPIAEPMSAEAFREQGFAMVPLEEEQPKSQAPVETPAVQQAPAEQAPEAQQPEMQEPAAPVVPNIDTMSAEELGGSAVEYMGDRASAMAYLEAERDKADAEVQRTSKLKVSRFNGPEDFKRQNDQIQAAKRAAIDRYNKLQNAITAANAYKTVAEQQEEAERKAREAALREQRRQLAEAETAGDIEAKWQNTKKTVGFAATKTLPNGQKVNGHYILTEAGDVIPSHDPRKNYADSEGYVMENGQNVNDNNYKDPDVQRIALDIAQNYGGQAVEQMPFLENRAGRVLSGNNRTISGIIAAENNTDQAYLAALAENAQQYGFTPEQLAEYEHPRLQFVVEDELPFTTATFAMFNQQEKKTKSSVNRAVANSKMVTEAVRDKMLEIMDQYESLDSFFGSESAAADIVQALITEGLMTQQEVAGLTENTATGFKFGQSGREYVTDMLLGTLFDEQTIKMLAGEKTLKQAILRALPSIVANRRLKGYELTDSINNAIQLLYEARKANEGKSTADAFQLYLRQVDAFKGSVMDRYNGFDIILANRMSAGVEQLREILGLYNNSAMNEANGQMGFFEPRTIDDIKQDVYEYYTNQQPELAAALDGAAARGAQPKFAVPGGVADAPETRQPTIGEQALEAAAEAEQLQHSVPQRPNSKMLQGMNYTVAEAEDYIGRIVRNILDENGYEDVEIVGTKVIGSRVNGDAREESDLDAIVEFKGDAREDSLFNLLHEQPIEIDGVPVDINPITEGKSGTIEQFMRRADEYLAEKEAAKAEREEFISLVNQYLTSISSKETKGVLFDNNSMISLFRELGFPEEMIQAIEEAQNEGDEVQVRGFNHNGVVFLNVDAISTPEDARNNYVHERQHSLTLADPHWVGEVMKATSEEELTDLLNKHTKNHYYDNKKFVEKADEFISYAMEIAYSVANNEELERALKDMGANDALINIIKSINDEQRKDNDLSLARRTPFVDGRDGRDSQQNGGDRGTRAETGLEPEGAGSAESGTRGTESGAEQVTPFEKTRLGLVAAEFRRQYPDENVGILFREKDTYEFYDKDAVRAAEILGLQTTEKDGVPFLSFPLDKLQDYLGKLVRGGMKIGITRKPDHKPTKGDYQIGDSLTYNGKTATIQDFTYFGTVILDVDGRRVEVSKEQLDDILDYGDYMYHVGDVVTYNGKRAQIVDFASGDPVIEVEGESERRYVSFSDIERVKKETPTEDNAHLSDNESAFVAPQMPIDTQTNAQKQSKAPTEDRETSETRATETEIGGALVDRLGDMGVSVSTDLDANRAALKAAKADKSDAGAIHYYKTPSGQQYGFSYKGRIYLDPTKIDAELPIHEYGHLWAEAMRRISPESWHSVVDTIKADQASWDFVRELRPELTDENEIAEEVIATFSGKRGAERLRAEYKKMHGKDADYKSKWGNIFRNISKAIQDFWKAVGDFLNIKYQSAEQIYDQVVKDFVDNMNPYQKVRDFLRARDAEYIQAAESGDIQKATNIFYDALRENIGNGITPYMSVGTYLQFKRLAKGVKTRDAAIIREAAEKIAPLIPDNAVLVPTPSHTGRATDMLDLANAIAEITGSEVADILRSAPRESQYQAKKETGTPMASQQLGIMMEGTVPADKTAIVIDNVVDSGNTAEACIQALGKGVVVTLADSAEQYRHAASLRSAAPILRDKDGNIVPLTKRFNLNGSRYLGRRMYLRPNDPRFAISGTQVIPVGEKTLVGLHNISAEKLRKVMKAGGLANPSAAVIDIAKQDHHDYGEVSLVLPSSLVERADGTYPGDAWTPMYPPVEYRAGKDTEKRIKALTKGLPDNLASAIALRIRDYMDGNSHNSGLEYIYLKEQGRELPIEHTPRRYPYISIKQIADRLGIAEPEYWSSDVYQAYEQLPEDQLFDFNLWLEQNGNQEEIDKRKAMVERWRSEGKDAFANTWVGRQSERMSFAAFDSAGYRILRDERDAGEENTGMTLDKASYIVDTEGLRPEFETWLQQKIDGLGYEEVLFGGYTPSGNRRWLPNTVENASRLMNQKSQTNYLERESVNETKAMLMEKFRTLAQIRKHRDILEPDREKIKEAYEAVSSDWNQLGMDFRDYTQTDKRAYQLDDNPFIAIDTALARIQEAMFKADPIAFLNREYRYSLPADSEFGTRIKEIKERIKNLPSRYFETKFRRPVYLNEFANAVVPVGLPQDLRDGLTGAGMTLFEYDPAEQGSRRAATLKATADEGIRFSISGNTRTRYAEEMESIKNEAVNNGTFMQAPNGKPTNLDERQWLQVRLRSFKRWFGDWENDPEDSSKVLDVNGEPMVVYHRTNNKFTQFDPERAREQSGWPTADFGFYFSNVNERGHYGRKSMPVFLNIRNPREIDVDYYADFDYNYKHVDSEEMRKGNDGLQINIGRLILDEKATKVFVTPNPNQIKSATDNDGSFSEENDDIRFAISNQNNDIFYSNAERAVEGIKQEKATPEQWRAMIEKAGGLKAGEDKWIGLSDWLAQQRPTVTPQANETRSQFVERAAAENKRFTLSKQDLLDYIRSNKIQIEEEQYGDVYDNPRFKELEAEFSDVVWNIDDILTRRWVEADNNLANFYDEMRHKYGEDFLDQLNEHEQSVERYLIDAREEFNHEVPQDDDAFKEMVRRYGDDFEQAFWSDGTRLFANENDAAGYYLENKQIESTRMKYTTEGLQNKREIALVVPTIESWNQGDEIHFGDAGEGRAVAWVRFGDTDRTLVDGRDTYANVLVIDEIQSKRHQEGREKGYRYQPKDQLMQEWNDAGKRRIQLARDWQAAHPNFTNAEWYAYANGEEYQKAIRDEQEAEERLDKSNKQIPAAPFEKNWHELAMKRILRFAAENGYDKVAWTTGDQQAARYNIGNHVDGIDANPFRAGVTPDIDYDGTQILIYTDGATLEMDVDKDGNVVRGYESASMEYEGKNISDIVGKEIARKLLTGEEVKLRGEDFRIGGEGMRGFYDDILPRFMQKYGKKWGVQVGEVTMPQLEDGYQTMHAVDINDAMRESVLEGQPMFSISGRGREDRDGNPIGDGDWHMNYKVQEFPEYLQISSRVDKSATTESVYVTYTNDDNGRSVKVRFSGHRSNAERFGDVLTGGAPRGEILYRLGLATKEWQPFGYVPIGTISNKQIEEGNYEVADKTRAELERLPKGTDISEYKGKLVPGEPNRIYTGTFVGESQSNGIYIYKDANGNIIPYGRNTDHIRFSISGSGNYQSRNSIVTEALVKQANDSFRLMQSALRKVSADLRTINAIRTQQFEYDRKVVNMLLDLYNSLLQENSVWAGYMPDTTRRIATQIVHAIGKKDISAEVNTIMDHMVHAQAKAAQRQWDKLRTTPVDKINISGVVMQGKVALQGQHALKAMNEALDSKATIEQLEDQIAQLMDMEDNATDESLKLQYKGQWIGYTIAAQHLERIQHLVDERNQLDIELQAARSNRAIKPSARQQLVANIQQAMRDNYIAQADAYAQSAKDLAEYVTTQEEQAKDFIHRQDANRDKIRSYAQRDLEGLATNPNRNRTRGNVARSIWDAFASPIRDLQSLLRLTGLHAPDGEGYLYNHFMRGWMDGADKERLGIVNAGKTLDAKISELTHGKYKTWEEAARKINDASHNMFTITMLNGVDGKDMPVEDEIPLNAGNALYIYAVNKMIDGKMKLTGMNITDEVVKSLADQVRGMFGQEILDVVDWVQREFFSQLRNRYNPTHEALFGAPMDAIENYFPLRINAAARQQNEDLSEPDTDAARLLAGTSTGAIKRRTKNSLPLDVRNADFFQEVIRHIAQMERWNAFAQWNRDANILFSDINFRNRIKGMNGTIYGSGDQLYNYMKDAFRVAIGTYKPKTDTFSEITLNIAKGVTSAKINFRVWTAMKQIASFPAFFTYMTDGVFVGSYLRNWMKPHETMKWAKEHLPNFEKRIHKRDLGDMRLMQRSTDWQWNKRMLEWSQRYGMAANVYFDTLTCATGARAVYDSHKADYLKKGYSAEDAERRAIQDAEQAFNTSQQSSEGAYLAPVQMDRNLVTAALTVFRTSPIQYTRNFIYHTRNLMHKFGQGTKAEQIAFRSAQYKNDGLTDEQATAAANKDYNNSIKKDVIGFVVYGALLNILWRLVGQVPYLLFGDDDDKKKEILKDATTGGALVSPITGLLGGGIIESALDGNGSVADMFAPEMPFTQDAKRAEQYLQNNKYAEFASQALSVLMQSGTGFDPQTAADLIQRIVTTIDSEEELSAAEEAIRISQALLSIPHSQYEQQLIDRVVADDSEYDAALEDYIRYQKVHTAPLTWWMRGEESDEKAEENAENRFNRLLDERDVLHNP